MGSTTAIEVKDNGRGIAPEGPGAELEPTVGDRLSPDLTSVVLQRCLTLRFFPEDWEPLRGQAAGHRFKFRLS